MKNFLSCPFEQSEIAMKKDARALLENAYEFHTHPAPSHRERLFDDFEYAKELDRYGMAGAVVKNHFSPTSARVALANKYAGAKARLFGSVTLDWPVGGLNPYAVESELLLGAAVVWLPTFHAQNWLERTGPVEPVLGPGITVLDDRGKLLPQVHQIIELVKKHNAVLGTGHLNPAESRAVCEAALAAGADVILTHPDSHDENAPPEMQVELAKKGVFLEKCWINIHHGESSAGRMAEIVKKAGADRCVMCTDLGNRNDPSAPEGMLTFIERMLDAGLDAAEVRTMIVDTPRHLLRA